MLYLNESNFRYLCEGLTLDAHDLEVLDHALTALEEKSGIISRIIEANHSDTLTVFKCEGPQIIVVLDKMLSKAGSMLRTSTVLKHKTIRDVAPAVHINMRSPILDIPQRIEIPLRYLLKGHPSLVGTYMVYLHALQINEAEEFVYYGLTKRGWMKRFQEHTKSALKGHSNRKFAKFFGESIQARINTVWNNNDSTSNTLTGTYHVVCTAGRTKQDAYEVEKHLIKKYSHGMPKGLNMV